MKTPLILAILFTILCQHASAQLIKNGDFATGDITSWTFINPSTYNASAAPGYTFSISKDPAKQNSSVLHISSEQNGQWCQFRQKLAYRATESFEKLRFTADVKIKSTYYATASLSARVLKGKKGYGTYEKTLADNQNWQKITLDFIVNPQTDSLAIFCSMKGGGEIWFDNINLVKINAEKIVQSDIAKIYLDSAIYIIRKHALNKDSVDFNSLVDYSRVIAADAKTPADCYAAIRFVLDGLQDHHSLFQSAEQAKYLNREEDVIMPMPSGKLLNNNIGYLRIPQCMAINSTMEKNYADSLQKLIKKIDNKSIIGWVVDDRGNSGGNCWPMLLGLGPVLGDGIFESKKNNDTLTNTIGYWDGIIRSGDATIIKTDNPYRLHNIMPKVAVLMDRMTASSGENVILSFKFRPLTKFFGEASAGLTSKNSEFILSDGAIMFVCTARQTDRLGNEYQGRLYPDVIVKDDSTTEIDETIDAASIWLRQK